MNFRYTTPLQNAQYLRARFSTATGPVAARLANLFLSYSDANLMNAFTLTQPQVDALRIRLQEKVDKYDSLELVEGE